MEDIARVGLLLANRNSARATPSRGWIGRVLAMTDHRSGFNVNFFVEDRAKLAVISKVGTETTIALLGAGDFLGEESVAAVAGP